MTATHGEGVYGNSVGVTTPLDHKMAQAGEIVKASGNLIRPGLFWGGTANIVTGKANMSYDVAAFTCASTRGATAGAVKWANPGTENVATTAAPGSNSRIDIIYAWHREFSLDGVNSDPVIGVIQGTAAAIPAAPSLAAFPGAIELGRATVAAGITATTSATITQTATFTAMAGGVLAFRNTTERDAGTYQQGQTGWLIDSGVTQVYNGSSWRSLGTSVMQPTSVDNGTAGPTGEITSGSVSLVRARGVFVAAQFRRYEVAFDISTASSTTLSALFAVAATDTATGYDNQRGTDVNGTAAAAQSLNTVAIITGGGVASTRHTGKLILWNPNNADETRWLIETLVSANPMTTAHGTYRGGGVQRAATTFDGISFAASAGNLTVNSLSITGVV